MDSPRTARRLTVALAVGVGLWCALLAWRWDWFIDLRVYELGASALFGGDLYDVRFHVADLPFTYPPFAAVLMQPLVVLPLWLTAALWSGACVLVLAWAINATLKACGSTYPALVVPALTAVALLSQPVWSTLSYGQVNLFLMAAILADALRPERRHAGWLVGIAAGVKLTPLFFVAFFLVIGQRRAAGVAVGSFAATVLVGVALAPSASIAYWSEILWDPSRIGGVEYAGNQSVLGTLSRLLGHEAPTSLWFVVAGSLAALSLVAAALLWRSTSPSARPLAVGSAALGMVLASPISWDHHWVWLVPITLALWLSGLPRARVVAGAVVLIASSRAIWWAPFRNGVEYNWSFWQGLSGNLYVLTAVTLVLCGLGWGLRSERDPASGEPALDGGGERGTVGQRLGVRRGSGG